MRTVSCCAPPPSPLPASYGLTAQERQHSILGLHINDHPIRAACPHSRRQTAAQSRRRPALPLPTSAAHGACRSLTVCLTAPPPPPSAPATHALPASQRRTVPKERKALHREAVLRTSQQPCKVEATQTCNCRGRRCRHLLRLCLPKLRNPQYSTGIIASHVLQPDNIRINNFLCIVLSTKQNNGQSNQKRRHQVDTQIMHNAHESPAWPLYPTKGT